VRALSLRDLLAAGPRAVSRYTGTLVAVFLVQTLVALACTLAIALLLSNAFAHLPIFDDAIDGDLAALITCVRWARQSFLAVAGIVLSAVFFWQLATWFLAGGLYGVLASRPEGRRETARTFGQSGAATYFAYARLSLCALPGWLVVMFVLGFGLNFVGPRIEYALTLPQLLGPLILAALPALILLHIFWTVADYARIELALRHESHAPGALATYLRTFAFVLRRPVTLLHGGLGWLLFAIVTLAYAYLAAGHPMYGTEGAITLFIARQSVMLLRQAFRMGIMAGQVELGRTRDLPPRSPRPTDKKSDAA
jgi:hypothetical protein